MGLSRVGCQKEEEQQFTTPCPWRKAKGISVKLQDNGGEDVANNLGYCNLVPVTLNGNRKLIKNQTREHLQIITGQIYAEWGLHLRTVFLDHNRF